MSSTGDSQVEKSSGSPVKGGPKLWPWAILLSIVLALWLSRGLFETAPDANDAGTEAVVAATADLTKLETEREAKEALLRLSQRPLQPGDGIPSDILQDMQTCLNPTEVSEQRLEASTHTASDSADSEVLGPNGESKIRILRTEDALVEIERELGPAMMQGDLWTDWIVKLPEGMGRKVHLENIEDEDGRIQQNLSLFQIDQSGKAARIFLSETEERNPDMATISNLLNEGEVQRKETSRFFQYAAGERLEIIELDGKPTELEIVRGEVFFRCDEMKSAENCTCIR